MTHTLGYLVDVGVVLEEDIDGGAVAVAGSPVDGRKAVFFCSLNYLTFFFFTIKSCLTGVALVDLGTVLEQDLDHFGVAVVRSQVQGGRAN